MYSLQQYIIGKMFKCAAWLVLFLVCVTAHAQEQKTILDRAEEAFARYDYAVAAKLFETNLDKVKKSITLLGKLAASYRETNNFEAAAKYYGLLTTMQGGASENWLFYADMLKSIGNYNLAKEAYAQYQQKTSKLMTEKIAGCDSAAIWMARQPAFTIENVKSVNTSKSDWGAVPIGIDNQIVFVSDSLRSIDKVILGSKVNTKLYGRTDNHFQKIYLLDSSRNGIDGSFIHDFSPSLNRLRYHTGPIVFTKKGDSAYYTITYTGKDALQKDAITTKHQTINLSIRRLELYLCTKNNNGEWLQAKPFTYNKPQLYSVGHAALSKDGNTLYFTSDMPGGVGGLDIWYCERKNDTAWDVPKNCGVLVNTKQDDAFPSIGLDGALYYASKGHVGIGGYDIFTAVGSKDRWTVPVNLGYPINSSGDDFYFVTKDEKSGFFSSNRREGKGDDDIYKFLVRKPILPRKIILETKVEDLDTRNIIIGAAVALSANTNLYTQPTNTDGKTYAEIDEDNLYNVAVSKLGYIPATESVATDGKLASDTIKLLVLLNRIKDEPKKEVPKVFHLADNIEISKLSLGDKIELRNLFYDFDKSNIRPDAAKVLDSLALILVKYPTIRIELSSHTDSRGNDAYNLALSDRRAKSAVQYLTSKGIDKDRMIAIGFGEMMLTNKCANGVLCTEPEHQMNRRTEVKILNL